MESPVDQIHECRYFVDMSECVYICFMAARYDEYAEMCLRVWKSQEIFKTRKTLEWKIVRQKEICEQI